VNLFGEAIIIAKGAQAEDCVKEIREKGSFKTVINQYKAIFGKKQLSVILDARLLQSYLKHN
jgi:hypothetical protein